MRWFFIFASFVGLVVFSIYAISGNTNNHAFTYSNLEGEYVNRFYDDDTEYLEKTIKAVKLFNDFGSNCFSTIKTFNISEDSIFARWFGNGIVNIIMLPINIFVNVYKIVVDYYNLFSDVPLIDGSSHAGGGGIVHGGK